MSSSLVKIQDEQVLANDLQDLSIKDLREKGSEEEGFGNHGGICAICLDKIVLQETALVKGCEHAYCVTCILRWATYSQNVTCPQCKHPFEFLNVHRSLDGSIQDYMFEESVCLLLRAQWFKPITIVEDHVVHEDTYDEIEDYYQYEEEDDDLDDEVYYGGSSSFRIGNRRWGDNGYVRAGRQEARPVQRSNFHDSGASSSREPKKKEAAKSTTGRRAKRALKREAADKAAEAKHQQHLLRLGRK
ncbi:Zinc finger, RING-type [Sesbania bispinosa]|nr:Zinc finger, RING-type [Sesbania bispinosa]